MPTTRTLGRRGERTSTAILEATSSLIAERGTEAFSISDVAKRAGVNRALIYHYFENRDNLIVSAIDHILSGYQPPEPEVSPDGVERITRAFIERPEVARFVFQLLLTKRPLLHLSDQLTGLVQAVEGLRPPGRANPAFDPPFAVSALVLAELSWALARDAIAELFNVSVDEADERYIAQLRYAAVYGIRMLHPVND
jgi:AcrR family transcriptional regulator